MLFCFSPEHKPPTSVRKSLRLQNLEAESQVKIKAELSTEVENLESQYPVSDNFITTCYLI